jgi:hypothetical protein
LKQTFSFGFSYAIVPWLMQDGYATTFGVMVAVNSAVLLLGVPLYFYGKQVRHKAAGWKIIYRA